MSLWTLPKITPFRLAFILTTSGLGIAKAAFISSGKTASSITVEWITGVAVAIIFQLLSSYDCEHNNARPQYMDWIFRYNCLGRSHTAIANPHPAPRTPPIVTGYRLLLSIMITAFGIAKMLCGYLGFSSAMYTLDWILAIPLTLGLYYIGLYEESRVRLLRKFFEVDYSSQTLLVFKIGSIALCYYWIKFWSGALRAVLAYSPSQDILRESTVWNIIFEHLLKWITISFCLVMLDAGSLSLLWPLIKACSRRYASSIWYGGLVLALVTLWPFLLLIYLYVILYFLFFAFLTFSYVITPQAPVYSNISVLERINTDVYFRLLVPWK